MLTAWKWLEGIWRGLEGGKSKETSCSQNFQLPQIYSTLLLKNHKYWILVDLAIRVFSGKIFLWIFLWNFLKCSVKFSVRFISYIKNVINFEWNYHNLIKIVEHNSLKFSFSFVYLQFFHSYIVSQRVKPYKCQQ